MDKETLETIKHQLEDEKTRLESELANFTHKDTQIKDNYTDNKTFGGYKCTEDCSGHEAGYEWAEDKGIEDADDCGGKSQSFIEGCRTYANENY